MWRHNGNPEQDRLNAYWDAVVSGASPESFADTDPGLDPNLTDAIAQVRALHRRHRPDPAFALHLETELMNAYTTTYPKSTVIRPVRPKGLVTRPTWLPHRDEIFPSRWSLAALATIALIAITLIVFLFNLRSTSQPAHVPGTPAAATPTAAPATVQPVSMYRGNPARTGVLPGPSLTGAPVELWKLQTGEPVNLGAAVVDGVLYLSGGSQGFEARDAMTGDLIWAFPTNAPAVSAPAVVDGQGYVIDTDRTLYAVRTTDGSEAWRMANINIRTSVAPVDGLVYAVSPEGTLYALDAATGAIAWQADTGAEAAGGMAVADGIVYQGNAAGVMSAFDAKTGDLRWTFQNEEGRGSATVTVANGQLYVTISGGDTNAMYAINAATGELTWRQEQGQGQGFISATATPTRLYSVTEDGMLHALDAETGETVWTYQLLEFMRSVPVLVDDTLYVADNGGFVRAIDPVTGSLLWEYAIAGDVDFGWPVVSNGVLYIGTSFGNFYAITGSDMIAAPSIPTATPAATPAAAGDGPLPATPSALTATYLWQAGGADSDLAQPDGIATAPDGSIWVPDLVNHEVHVFEPDGTPRQVIALNDAGAGSFVFGLPDGGSYASIAVDVDGNVYVLDSGHFRVVKFDANGQFVQELSFRDYGDTTPPYSPDIAAGPDGSVYVADYSARRVLRLSASGELAAVIGQPESVDERLVEPSRIGVDAAGNVYVSDFVGDTAEVKVYAPDGTFLRRFGNGDLQVAIDVAVDANGIAYVTDPTANQVKLFDGNGALIGAVGESGTKPGQFTGIDSVAVDANGNLYVVDFEGHQVEAFHLTWITPAEAAASPDASPAAPDQVSLLWQTTGGPTSLLRTSSARIAPDGNIWVADGGHSQFQIFAPDGTFIEAWGTPGSGDGQFDFVRPNSNDDSFGAVAFAPDGSFYVADTGNHRIQHFSADRTFLHAWGGFGGEDGQFISPIDLAVDADGQVYVGDDRREDLQVFTADGAFVRAFGGNGDPEFQGWITLGPDGTIWGADGQQHLLHQWRTDGTLLRTIEVTLGDGTPVIVGDVAVDEAGNLLVPDGDNGRLLLLDPNGVLLMEWEVAHVGGMVLDGAGAYYTTDYGAGLLIKYRLGAIPDGTPTK